MLNMLRFVPVPLLMLMAGEYQNECLGLHLDKMETRIV